MVFTRNFWEKFKSCKPVILFKNNLGEIYFVYLDFVCSKNFCRYDDYNWDWSFNYAINKCFKYTFSSVHTLTSRIMHMGAWYDWLFNKM